MNDSLESFQNPLTADEGLTIRRLQFKCFTGSVIGMLINNYSTRKDTGMKNLHDATTAISSQTHEIKIRVVSGELGLRKTSGA